ncbi:heme-degrading domain-containing protein [Salinispira pacifica]
MSDLSQEIAQREKEEIELQFDRFTNEMALEIGILLVEQARSSGSSVAVNVERDGHQLFHHAMTGTAIDNDEWIKRKIRVVHRFGKSSFHVGQILARDGTTIQDRSFVDPMEFSAHGGSFPITIRGTGIIGTITVSGLPQEEDHKLVTRVIRDYLARS